MCGLPTPPLTVWPATASAPCPNGDSTAGYRSTRYAPTRCPTSSATAGKTPSNTIRITIQTQNDIPEPDPDLFAFQDWDPPPHIYDEQAA